MDRRKAPLGYRILERPWDARLEAGLLALETPDVVAWHEAEVAAGREHPIVLQHGARQLATALYRFDHGPQGREFVVMGAIGFGVDMPRTFGLLEHMARINDCRVLRFHTTRAGLVRRAAVLGYGAVEFVMSKRVD